MKKRLLYPALWGILALSILSSCRTEDNITQQNKVQEAKYFSVFVPKVGEKINYANGFAFLMKRYDELHKTNLSGINNNPILGNLSASTSKTASVFQNTGVYVEFAVRSQTITEENGDKWVVFPKVEGNKVVSLVAAVLSQKETYVSYHIINQGDELYKRNINRFQEALARYQKQRVTLALNASIKPMAGSGCSNNGVEYDNCGIPEVVIDVPPRGGGGGGTGFPDGGGTGCLPYELCVPGNDGGGGGGSSDPLTEVSPNIRMKLSDQQKYPRFTKMVKNLEQFVKNNPVVLKALIKNTGLTEAKVLEGLKWGKGPEIAIKDFTDNPDRYGQYTDGTNVLEINAKYVRGLEIVSLPASQKNTSFLLAITILHEYTHFGDYMADGKKEVWEMGWGFEQDILGKARATVEKDNAHIYIKMFNF
ncbi:hypothetical protein [Elizabethkingia anophelis]|uniref:hypothetical protein n=1 Tax=Elizabethkingia anophelis TaxID=1117645 RepID=UPI001629158B|nr:hypothetical protein [Elizabethkingia anophelis]MCT4321581.1 hypothetical protein [Elizabethkingia anophelis]HAY3533779.1 hypothetical protein [Elizabethkingia anophelis]HAY3545895.1 hypothetical protein [Elizabethkingia anophelis]HAY3590721.1 hypothetical protein [Elizabethkingia anophelis]